MAYRGLTKCQMPTKYAVCIECFTNSVAVVVLIIITSGQSNLT